MQVNSIYYHPCREASAGTVHAVCWEASTYICESVLFLFLFLKYCCNISAVCFLFSHTHGTADDKRDSGRPPQAQPSKHHTSELPPVPPLTPALRTIYEILAARRMRLEAGDRTWIPPPAVVASEVHIAVCIQALHFGGHYPWEASRVEPNKHTKLNTQLLEPNKHVHAYKTTQPSITRV